jgi:hypothetical protein
MSTSFFTKRWFPGRIGAELFFPAVVLWLAFAATPARADWPNEHPTKYHQPPDLTPAGYNVFAATGPGSPAAPGQPLVLADDFPCTQTGPITDIHIWASWLGDSAALNIAPIPITLGIWSDVPASPGAATSHPGVLLWSQTFLPGGALPGHYKIAPKGFAPSPFWDPDPPPAGNIMGNDSILWQYNFYADPANAFVQQGTATAPTNYWLSVSTGTNTATFGWRVSAAHYNDNSVFGHLDPSGTTPLNDWQPMFDPKDPAQRLDLAFAITTTPQTPPPTPTSKWLQSPDLLSGFGLDVNATAPNTANGLLTLADDFQCTMVGPITNIQFWGSLKNDVQPGGHTFVVSIWSDAPKTAANFSQPFQRLWSQTYGPNDYTVSAAGTGTEHFFDAETGLLAPETNVWRYSFDLTATNPFCQQGKGTIYWVSIAAISPPAAFLQWGWKTSTNRWGDVGVYGRVDPLSAAVLTGWHPLFNPTWAGTVPLPVDFAFQISSGPPSADCDPALGAASIQPPDTSPNGLDVWALQPTTVGDDFPCRIRGPISGFTIWGSWLNDQVDTNASFQVNLWTDVPGSAATGLPYSHPGQLVCSSIFSPPQTLGDVMRYQYSLFRSNLQETFYNPNLPGNSGLIGNDTQIWRYDFFPFVPSCFFQDGSPFSNNKVYWVTVSYLPPAGTVNNDVFGWKTSTRHFQDTAVYGTNGVNWSPLVDPRNGTALDLAKIVWKFPVTGINKDIYNLTPSVADGIQVVLSGPHLITWHYDDSPPWAFTSYLDGTNTVLQWSGRTVPVGGFTHVGYETPGSILPTMVAMNWLSGTNVLGPVVQGNWHLLGDPFLIFDNDFFTGPITFGDGSIEFYDTPPPLDQMINGGTRNPLAVQRFQAASGPVSPGGAAVMLNPQPLPPKTAYALIIVVLNGGGSIGARDFVLVPLDQALIPAIQSLGFSGNGDILLHFDSIIGRSYQLQSSGNITNPGWMNMGDPVMATGNDSIFTAPMNGQQNFYRIMLMP